MSRLTETPLGCIEIRKISFVGKIERVDADFGYTFTIGVDGVGITSDEYGDSREATEDRNFILNLIDLENSPII